ncbi:hypothetical protein ACTND0_10540, partial [Lactobacillus amylovorus]|uniref:hypothetical protein n=1 Tax=Lactobacillus amylovorus TaxID=1604 RepID=UPI003F8CD1C3
WYQRTLCSEACASFLMQKILLIEYHRNLSTGFIIEPKLCRQNDLLAFFVEKGKNSEDRKITKRN